jgi:hypothetical protein
MLANEGDAMNSNDKKDDIAVLNELIGRLDLERTDRLAESRIIGLLLGFKNREGRFPILESMFDYLADKQCLAGFDGTHTENEGGEKKAEAERRTLNPQVPGSPCWYFLKGDHADRVSYRWVFGSNGQWEADQCFEIFALHKENWNVGKCLPDWDIYNSAIGSRINRLLVLCLPPEDFAVPHAKTWETFNEELNDSPVQTSPFQRLIQCPESDSAAGGTFKILSVGDELPPEKAQTASLETVRKRALAPAVTTRYVWLSRRGDILPWLRDFGWVAARREDAALSRVIEQVVDHLERCHPGMLTEDGNAAERENEIRQKLELEIAFRKRLAEALDRAGYDVTGGLHVDAKSMERLRERYENQPADMTFAWTVIKPKDAGVGFSVRAMLSSGESLPSFKWRESGIDGVRVVGPSKSYTYVGGERVAACPPLRYNVSVVDERLQFRTLSPAAMRKVLLGGTLAEELASKITSAFTRLASKSNEPVP